MSLPLVLLSGLLATTALYYLTRRRRLPLPPGPTGYPLLGNTKELIRGEGRKHAWLEYAELGETYGGIVYLETFGQKVVIINSAKIAFDVLDKRSYNYSDRPSNPMLLDLMGLLHSYRVAYSDVYTRAHRKMFHQSFQNRTAPSFIPTIQHYSTKFLDRLLKSPNDFRSHILHYAGSIILRIIYDYELKGEDDAYLALFHEAMESVNEGSNPGMFLVDLFPVLKYIPSWFPGASFKRRAKKYNEALRTLIDVPYESARQRIAAQDNVSNSFVAYNIEKQKCISSEIPKDVEEVIKNCAAVGYLAGADTTTATILTFVLAMVLNPAILKKAQEEMDMVTGGTRFPSFDDRPELPYLEAVYWETFRWMPALPLGVSHKALHDDVYRGYYIPEGSTVVPNTWAILHDASVYPDPSTFNPQRFLRDKHSNTAIPPLPSDFAFGFGRRICPGRSLAMEGVWLALANLIALFNIEKAKDEDGNEIIPVVDVNDGVICCLIMPRSEQAIHLINTGLEKGYSADLK